MDTEGDSCNFDYNWDEISVGNFRMNHSNHFFVQKHPEHEKFYKNNPDFDQQFTKAFPNTVHNGVEDVAEVKTLIECHKENLMNQPNQDVKTEVTSPKREIAVKTEAPSPNKDEKCETKQLPKPTETNKCDKEFNVVRFAKIYDVKKKATLNAIQQKEREQREFHSKPAPNFHAIHAAVERKRQQQVAKVTCPLTPSVLRRHIEKQVQLQKHKEEYEASLRPKPFVSNSDPEVLRKKPFVPQIEKCHITPVPFNLQSDARLKERKQFDENFKTESDRRQQEKDEQRKRDEERMRKELRKATVFKAQPNPFK